MKINAGDVGGPSAGTMFSLAVYDTLTPGALTGGQKIAGTGTIDSLRRGRPDRRHPPEARRAPATGAPSGSSPRPRTAPRSSGTSRTGCGWSGSRTFDEARAAVEAIGAKRADDLPTCG